MKLNYIVLFVVGFSLFAVTGLSLYNETINTYEINGIDLGLEQNNSLSSSYNLLNEVYTDINGTRNALDSGNQNPGTDANFFFNFDAIKGAVETLFDSFRLVSQLGNSIGKDLNVPPIVDYAISTIVILSLLGVVINLIVRWKANG